MINKNRNASIYHHLKRVFVLVSTLAVLLLTSSSYTIAKSRQSITASPDNFSAYVIELANSELPNLSIESTDSPFVLKINNDGKISLDNLYKRVRNLKSRKQVKSEVKNFLSVMADIPSNVDEWADAKARILPQIFPKEYLKDKAMKNTLVSRPLSFSNELLEGYVIDSEKAFQYINNKHLKKWGIDTESVRNTAYENLNSLTKATRLRAKFPRGKNAEGKFLTIQVNDGFAAARLLLPQMRQLIESKLGKPCYVAIPNRDLLIAWSYDCSQKKKFQRQVVRQFHFRDHPLSPTVYAIINSKIEDKNSIDNDTNNNGEAKTRVEENNH